MEKFKDISIVIQGDFVLRITLWGNTVEKSDARGDEIAEFAVRCQLDIFNDTDCDPTFSSARGDS